MTLHIGSFLPTSTANPRQPILGDIAGAARFAEETGLDSVWSTDHLIASAPIVESTVTLATAAAVTERIDIGWAVLLLALRPTAWAAKQAAALQYVSGDRLLLGIGTGNPAHSDIGFRAAGTTFADRGPRTDVALRVLPDLIAGRETILPDGTVATLSPGATVPPILVAGNGSRVLRRAAEFADSWIAMGTSADEIPSRTAELAELATGFGRPTPDITVVTAVPDEASAAVDVLSGYAEVGVTRVIVPPADGDWRRGYEYVAKVKQAL